MSLLLSLKLAIRAIKRSPIFSSVIIFTFAIATGASIVIFSYIDALLLSPLPFKEPQNLVRIYSMKGEERGLLSYPEFLDMQKQLQNVEALAVYRDGGRYNLSGDGKPPEDLTTTFVSSNLFEVLGVEPQIGSYWPQDLDERGSHTIMLTHDFWQKRFDGKEEINKLQVTLDGFSYTNYGVMPEGFSFPHRNEAFRAMAFADFIVTARDRRPCIGLARLNAGVNLEDLNKELQKFAELQQKIHLDSNLGITFIAEPLSDLYLEDIYGYLILLGMAALFLLIIATVNVSNLIVNRSILKSKEVVIRKVLGSSYFSIIKDSIVYCVLLAFLGSLTGLFFAHEIMLFSKDLISPFLPYWIKIGVNQNVLLYALIISILIGSLTGALSWVFNYAGKDLVSRLKEGQRSTGSTRQRNLQKGLAVLQIATSVVLMIGGMLLFKSFTSASATDLGFEEDKKVVFRIALSWFKYGGAEKKAAFFENSLREIEAIPGVENVALNTILPLSDMVETSSESQENFVVEGQSQVQQSENPFISTQRVTPNYFDVMGIEMQEGSSFDYDKFNAHHSQVIIDRKLAEKLWPDGDALGKRIKIGSSGSENPFLTIIGIAENVKHQSIMGENIPNIYLSIFVRPHTDAHYIVNTSKSLSELQPLLTETILSLDENQPTFEYMLMEDIVAMKNWQAKVSGILFLTIASIGSVIAAIGLFSMMTFILLLKVKELALRRILGANNTSVLNLVFKDMLKMSGVGIVCGVLISPLLLKPIAPYLFQVGLIDFSIYAQVILLLLAASILATLVPFRDALFVNPVNTLRRD